MLTTTPSAPSAAPAAPGRAGGPRYIPIVARNDVYLFWLAGDGRRFARLFQQVWRRLPLGVRRELLRHWRTSRPYPRNSQNGPHWPHIELVAGKSDFSRGNSRDAMAQTCSSASSFAFDARSMDAISDAAVEVVIAHELAHAIYFIDCRQEHMANAPYDDWGFSQAEYDADELAESWGFDAQALWESPANANGITTPAPSALGGDRSPE